MESLLGRSLREDESIAISVYKPAPAGEMRERASRSLLERIDKTSQKLNGIPDEEIDRAIDVAVRSTKESR